MPRFSILYCTVLAIVSCGFFFFGSKPKGANENLHIIKKIENMLEIYKHTQKKNHHHHQTNKQTVSNTFSYSIISFLNSKEKQSKANEHICNFKQTNDMSFPRIAISTHITIFN